MNHDDRPTDMLLRQQEANRKAARYRDDKGRQNFCHLPMFRFAFIRDILAIRAELRKRKQ